MSLTTIIQTIKNKIASYEAYLDDIDTSYHIRYKDLYENNDPHKDMYENTRWHECMKDPKCRESRNENAKV